VKSRFRQTQSPTSKFPLPKKNVRISWQKVVVALATSTQKREEVVVKAQGPRRTLVSVKGEKRQKLLVKKTKPWPHLALRKGIGREGEGEGRGGAASPRKSTEKDGSFGQKNIKTPHQNRAGRKRAGWLFGVRCHTSGPLQKR